MATLISAPGSRFALVLGCALSAAACNTGTGEVPDGTCAVNQTVTCTGAGIDGGAPPNLGLVGYTCTGTARPDQNARYPQGVPQGIVCANQTAPADGGAPQGSQTYCCTDPGTPTSCVYDPVAVCDPGLYAYQCLDINRPESFNPLIRCGQGVNGGATIDYCCSGTGVPAGCQEDDGLDCTGGLIGWQCPASVVPKGQDLGANKSRADSYLLLCSIAQPAPNPKIEYHCCYPPAPVPPGGSCIEDLQVPGCAPGRFGFACYGPDTPPDDYPPIKCPDPGVAGQSSDGYPATLYCCDFE